MKKIKYLVLMLGFVGLFCSSLNVSADSGWGSNYSPGFSWGSGSSWGGSSYSGWSFDYSGGSVNHNYADVETEVIYILIVFCVLLVSVVISMIKSFLLSLPMPRAEIKQKNPVMILEESKFVHDYDDVVKKYFPQYTEKSLIENLFKVFVDIQIAWMNFDYDSLKKLCTDELYQSYKMDLEQLKSNHRQNVMYDFSLIAGNIMEIVEENDIIIVKLFMHASFYDYVVDTDSNKIVRGYSQTFIHNQYNMDFIVTKRLLKNCPNCGKELNGKNECDYCHSHINDNYSDFVLSKKNNI